MTHDPQNLTDLLDSLSEKSQKGSVTVREILDGFGRRSHGALLFFPGFLVAAPTSAIPGVSIGGALLIFLISVQIVLSPRTPWMPRRLTRMEIGAAKMDFAIRWSRPIARFVDRFLSQRLTFLFVPPFLNFGIALCAALSLLMVPYAFIPFAASVAGLAVALFGLGIISRDGILALGAGFVAALSAAFGAFLFFGAAEIPEFF